MLSMTTPRKKEVARPRPGKKSLNTWLPIALIGALEIYIRQTKPRPDKTAVVELALEEYLARVGFWPPADEESPS